MMNKQQYKPILTKDLKKLLIKEIDYGIACRIGKVIYINKYIKKWSPKLYKAIIEHEMEHSDNYTIKDVTMDISNEHIREVKKQYYSFILNHPRSWIEFLPAWKYDGELIISPTISALYILIGGASWLIFALLKLY